MLVCVEVLQKTAPVAAGLGAAHRPLADRGGHNGVRLVVALTSTNWTMVCRIASLHAPDEYAIRTKAMAIRTATGVFQDAITNEKFIMIKNYQTNDMSIYNYYV